MAEFQDINLKPHFNFLRILCSSNVMAITIIILVLLILFFVSDITAKFIPTIIILAASIIGVIELSVLFNYNATKYTINEEKIDFKEGFINNSAASIKIKNIKEIHHTQSFIQRICHLGSIRILTTGSSGASGGGLVIQDIENSDYAYMQINQLIKKSIDQDGIVINENDKFVKYKPETKTPYLWLISIPQAVIGTIILTAITYGISFYIKQNITGSLTIALITGLISFIVLSLLCKLFVTLEYDARSYLIHSSKIESKEGFFNYQYTTIYFKNIREIRLERGYFQRLFNLGTVVVTTPTKSTVGQQDNQQDLSSILFKLFVNTNADKQQMSYYKTGIKLVNLKDYSKVYNILRELLLYSETGKLHDKTNDVPKAVYKPSFKLILNILRNLAWLSLGIIVLLPLLLIFLFTDVAVGSILSLVILSATFLIPLWLKKKNYDCTKYEIYPSRIEFHEGFIMNKSSSILIKNIREIHFKENFLQKFFKLGTIKVITSGSTDTISENNSGEAFLDIENGKIIYEKLKDFIKENSPTAKVAASINNSQNSNTIIPAVTTANNIETQHAKIQQPTTVNNIKAESFELKPKVSFFNLLINYFCNIFSIISIGTILVSIQIMADEKSNFHLTFAHVIIGFLVIFVFSILATVFASIVTGINYHFTKYEFLNDKLNFSEGFINNNYTSIEYKNIREIRLEQNLAQRICQLGTIRIFTSADTSFSGLPLKDIKKPLEVYDKIKNNMKSSFENITNNENNIIMKFKPKFCFIYAVLCYVIPWTILVTLFTGSILIMLLAPIFIFIGAYIKHKATNYTIYTDRIEFEFKFINKKHTTIFNEKLREIHFTQGFMQRIFRIGTFKLVTSFSGGKGTVMFNVRETDKLNDMLQGIANKNKN